MSLLPLLGPLLGGLFTSRAQRRANNANSVRGRVADARAAGIHPLVALQANLPAQQPVSMGAAIENAVALAHDQRSKERQLKIQAAQLEMQNLELRNKLLQGRLKSSNGGVYGTPTGAKQQISRPMADNRVAPFGAPVGASDNLRSDLRASPDSRLIEESPERKISTHRGDLVADQRWSKAEDFEEEYGEVGAAVYGVAKLLRDGVHTANLYLKRRQNRSVTDPDWAIYQAKRLKIERDNYRRFMRSRGLTNAQ